jgi:hypothetical protein
LDVARLQQFDLVISEGFHHMLLVHEVPKARTVNFQWHIHLFWGLLEIIVVDLYIEVHLPIWILFFIQRLVRLYALFYVHLVDLLGEVKTWLLCLGFLKFGKACLRFVAGHRPSELARHVLILCGPLLHC